jgi:hypothetical protein
MPLTDDQKARIEELSGKEMLTTAEADELAQLENIPETEEEESFDDAWDELEVKETIPPRELSPTTRIVALVKHLTNEMKKLLQ